MMFLGQKANFKKNNFDFLRFFAATLVIISHSYILFGVKSEPFYQLTKFDTFAGIAVKIFFIISGFLITKSWLNNPNILVFIKKRVLRIFPALIASILFSVFIIGPVVTTISLKEYFFHPQTKSYLKNVFLFPIRFDLPGVFINNPYKKSVNGSLWTLPIEFLMYIIISVVGSLGLLKKRE